MAGLEHALLDGVVVRLQPTRVVALQVGEQVHNEGFVARYQKVLVHGARRPEGVHLLPYFLVLGVPACKQNHPLTRRIRSGLVEVDKMMMTQHADYPSQRRVYHVARGVQSRPRIRILRKNLV